jgi:hypothetical protein
MAELTPGQKATEALTEQLRLYGGMAGALAQSTRTATGAMKLIGPGLALAMKSLTDAYQEQTSISQHLVLTGKQAILSDERLGKALDQNGLSFAQAADVMRTTMAVGLRDNVVAQNKFIGQARMLGVNIQEMSRLLVSTNDILGFTASESIELGRHLVETGAKYGIHTDILVGAIHQWITQMKQAQASLGPTLQRNVAGAVAEMVGKFGVGAREQIQAAAASIFGGTPEAFMTARRLGVSNLTPASSAEAVESIMNLLQSAQSKVAGMRGSEMAQMVVPRIQAAYGFPPEVLQLADNLSQMTEAQKEIAMDEMLAIQMQNSLSQNLNNIMRPFKIQALKILNAIAKTVEFMSPLLKVLVHVLIPTIITWLTLIAAKQLIDMASRGAGRLGAASQLLGGRSRLGGASGLFGPVARGLGRFMTGFGKFMLGFGRLIPIIGWVITGLMGGMVLWKYFANDAKHQRDTQIAESRKLTDILAEGQNKALARLAANQNQVRNTLDILALNSKELLEEQQDGNSNIIAATQGLPGQLTNTGFSIQNRTP